MGLSLGRWPTRSASSKPSRIRFDPPHHTRNMLRAWSTVPSWIAPSLSTGAIDCVADMFMAATLPQVALVARAPRKRLWSGSMTSFAHN
jgi:hypothetical protein